MDIEKNSADVKDGNRKRSKRHRRNRNHISRVNRVNSARDFAVWAQEVNKRYRSNLWAMKATQKQDMRYFL